MLALQRDRRQTSPDDFPQQLAELLAYLEDEMPRDHPFARLAVLPGVPDRPEVWLLGSSPQSGDLGGRARACRTPSPTSSTRAVRGDRRGLPAALRGDRRRDAPYVAVGVP